MPSIRWVTLFEKNSRKKNRKRRNRTLQRIVVLKIVILCLILRLSNFRRLLLIGIWFLRNSHFLKKFARMEDYSQSLNIILQVNIEFLFLLRHDQSLLLLKIFLRKKQKNQNILVEIGTIHDQTY